MLWLVECSGCEVLFEKLSEWDRYCDTCWDTLMQAAEEDDGRHYAGDYLDCAIPDGDGC